MSWEITGNTGTNPAINFVGTTDSQPLVIKVDGTEAMRIDASGLEVAGDIRLTNADCAQDFKIGGNEPVGPGTVMVLDEQGALIPSQHAHDKKVAGVVSGAGGYKPGIVLDKQQSGSHRQPIALLDKTYCKADAGVMHRSKWATC